MKPTPGPWTADSRVIPWHGGEQPGCMVRFQDGRFGKPIANCLARDTGIPEAVANAHLIAAAPEMLEALETIARDAGLEALCASKRDDTAALQAWCEIQHRCDAAIKKAKEEL